MVGSTFWIIVTAADFDAGPDAPALTSADIAQVRLTIQHRSTGVKEADEVVMDYDSAGPRWLYKWVSSDDDAKAGTYIIRAKAIGVTANEVGKDAVRIRLEKDPIT